MNRLLLSFVQQLTPDMCDRLDALLRGVVDGHPQRLLRVAPHVNYIDSLAPIMVSGPIRGVSNVSWDMLDADFQQLCADRRFFTAMASSMNYMWDSTATLMRWADQLEEIRDSVDAELASLRDGQE